MSNTDHNGSPDRDTSRMHPIIAGGRIVLFGCKSRLSAWIWSIAFVSTVAVAALVAVAAIKYTPTGPTESGSIALHSASYTQLIELFVSTYSAGHNYLLFVIAPIALLLGAVASAYLNSGLLPTGGLVLGPIFGFFINRAGEPTVPGLVPTPLPLTDAIIFALTGAFLYGIPITVLGFIVGTVLRKAVHSEWRLS